MKKRRDFFMGKHTRKKYPRYSKEENLFFRVKPCIPDVAVAGKFNIKGSSAFYPEIVKCKVLMK